MENKDWKYLINVKDEFDANRVIDLLETNDIEVYRKFSQNSQVTSIYMGITMFGIDIFVEKDKFNKAKSLLSNYYKDLKPE